MASNPTAQRYRALYQKLLRLYPRRFHERFGEGMAQTFQDLCREHTNAGRGLFWLTFRTCLETSAGIVKENTTHMSQLAKTIFHVALWSLALLMVPIVASQFVPDWNWPIGSFVFVYLLFFGTGMVYAAIARKVDAWSYKVGVGLSLAAGFALGWSNMVHVADSANPKNLIYYSVLAVGVVGACLARLQPRGLARTLFAMAATLVLIALILPSGAPPNLARNMAIGHTVLAVLFTASGLFFRHASVARLK